MPALFLLNAGVVALLFLVLHQLNHIQNKLMKIRIEETTITALVTLAEVAVSANAHSQADLTALQATVANEEDLPADLKARIDALTAPATTA